MLSGLLGPSADPGGMHALFSSEAIISAALDFEAALAQACAAEQLIEPAHQQLICAAIRNLNVDADDLTLAAHQAGTLAIPLVDKIRTAVASSSAEAAAGVHLGSTSQDLADTVLALQCRRAADLSLNRGWRVCDRLAELAARHAATPMVGRTLLRSAMPITFGFKVSNWLTGLSGSLQRLAADSRQLTLQCGGAVGTFAGLNGRGKQVAEHMADSLDLPAPNGPWHTQRTNTLGLAASLALTAAALGKMANDLALLGQDEIAEVAETGTAGRGGSSAMPHKRNPTGSAQCLAATRRMPGLLNTLLSSAGREQERGLSGWQLELPLLAEMFIWTFDALQHADALLEGLQIHPDAMLRNLRAAGVGTDWGEAQTLTATSIDNYRSGR